LAYRRLTSSEWIAGFSAFMFATAESHAISVGWIAARNALLEFLFSIGALYSHILARHDGRRGFERVSSLCAALALLSGESGTAAIIFLVAYAVMYEHGSLYIRGRSISPQLLVGLVWAVIYIVSGSGSSGSSFYRNVSRPWEVVAQGVLDLPLWVIALFGPPGVGGLNVFPVVWTRLACLPLALGILVLLFPVLRRSAEARFFALVTFLTCRCSRRS
jgi:hypothetical protein